MTNRRSVFLTNHVAENYVPSAAGYGILHCIGKDLRSDKRWPSVVAEVAESGMAVDR